MPLTPQALTYSKGKIASALFESTGASPLLTRFLGHLLVASPTSPGMKLLPPGTIATITRALNGGQTYFTAGVDGVAHRILLNWERDGNSQTGYTESNEATTVLGNVSTLKRFKARPRKLSVTVKPTSTFERGLNDTDATIQDEYVVGSKPEVIIHHMPILHKEL